MQYSSALLVFQRDSAHIIAQENEITPDMTLVVTLKCCVGSRPGWINGRFE